MELESEINTIFCSIFSLAFITNFLTAFHPAILTAFLINFSTHFCHQFFRWFFYLGMQGLHWKAALKYLGLFRDIKIALLDKNLRFID